MGRKRGKGNPSRGKDAAAQGAAPEVSRAGSFHPGSQAPAEEEIDLHGLAIDEAMVQVELTLARWRHRPGACIRIIHGQSSGSKDSIKGALRRNLETQWKSRVRTFRPELGNAGATLVFIAG